MNTNNPVPIAAFLNIYLEVGAKRNNEIPQEFITLNKTTVERQMFETVSSPENYLWLNSFI